MSTDATTAHIELDVRVRSLIEDGHLPAELDNQINAGYGDGNVCSVCDQAITRYQVEYGCSDVRTMTSLCFHLRCYRIWQRECKRRVS